MSICGRERAPLALPRLPFPAIGLAAMAVLVATCVPLRAQDTWLGSYRIDLRANPNRLAADGLTPCRIQADVRRFDGSPAADGTQIVFNTDLGNLSLGQGGKSATVDATTRGGLAIVFLSSDAAGSANVTARVQDSRTVLHVTFLAPGSRGLGGQERPPRSMTISGKWVGYCAEANAVEARGRSRITFGRLTIDVGDVAVLNVQTLQLRALGVVLHRDKAKVEAESICADLMKGEVLVQRMAEGSILRQRLSMETLTPVESDDPIPSGSFSVDEVEGDTWFVGTTVRVFPNEKVVLRSASVYSGNEKVLSLPPYWILAMPGFTGASNSAMVGVNSEGGFAFDMPFFYQVTDTWTNSVRLQKGTTMASVSAREGWSLALHNEYNGESGSLGYVTLAGIPRNDWGLAWHDNRTGLQGSQLFTDLNSPDHSSVYLNSMLYRTLPSHQFSLSANLNRSADLGASYGATAQWLTYPRPFGGSKRVEYSLGTSLNLDHGADSTDSAAAAWLFGNDVYGSVGLSPRGLGNKWSLQPRVENVFSWFSDWSQRDSLRGELALNGTLGGHNPLRLTYSATHQSGDVTVPGWEQELDLWMTAYQGKWTAYFNATHSLTTSNQMATLSTDYRVTPSWRFGALYTQYDFGLGSFSDTEFTLARQFFGQEFGLRWSRETGRFSVSAIGLNRNF